MASRATAPHVWHGVIDDARRQHRRRRRRIAATVTLATAAIATALVPVLVDRVNRAPTPAAGPTPRPAAALLARTPYLGVHCPIENSTACERVGLAVWLRAPARTVSATIAGRRLSLSTAPARAFAAPGQRSGTMFVGYLEPAGIVTRLHARPDATPIRWWAPSPSNAPAPRVTIRIVTRGGRAFVTALDVPLEAGWG
jgi:hypothetical protein